MSTQPHVSIVIVNHHAEAILPECTAAVAAGNQTLTLEIIIVDNPSLDPPVHLPAPPGISLRRVAAPKRLGFGAACNLGVSHAQGECVLLLNPDVVLDPAAISELHTALTDRTDTGIAVGRLRGMDGAFQATCRRFPTIRNLFVSRGSILHRVFGFGDPAYTLPDYHEITSVDASAAALLMMTRELYEALSGFDETFFMYLEDTDLCYRASRLGQKTIYVPRAGGRHMWGYSTRRYRFRRIIWHHHSIWRYFVKHHGTVPTLAGLGPLLSLNCFLSLLVEMCTLRK